MAPSLFKTCVALEGSLLATFRSVQYFEIDHPFARNIFEKS